MKFNPPCYSVTFELLDSLTDSSVEKASVTALCVCEFTYLNCNCVCVCLCFLVTASVSLRSGDIFHRVRSFWPFLILSRGQFTRRRPLCVILQGVN